MTESAQKPLICVVGPTATGKTELALKLARRFGGEIICADSRTIYRDLDIGTAKPSEAEQAEVPHHLLDVVDPDQFLGAAEFKRLANEAVGKIRERGRVPFLVGGSGLYVDAVVFDYQFPPRADLKLRNELDLLSDSELQRRLLDADPEAMEYVDLANRRRVIRAIETAGFARQRLESVPANILMLGKDMNNEVIQSRIADRVKKMLSKGLIEEVSRAAKQYGWEAPGLQAPAYRSFKPAILGQKTAAESAADFARADWLLAKRQRTWFKRNSAIHWIGGHEEAERLVSDFIARQTSPDGLAIQSGPSNN